ncbi:MAG: 4Fe-4S dicluster domain-containing protein [Desulfuromonadales bacterium]
MHSSITHKRRIVQALLIAVALLLPFATIGGNPVLRMDIALRTLFLGGIAVRVDQFYLVLLATLLGIALFLLITVILGRVWCGWLCPQTVFNDLAELVSGWSARRLPGAAARPLDHLTALLISASLSFIMLCWFITPAQTVAGLTDISTHPLLVSAFLGLTLFGYLNLVLVRRSFCRSYCPYGRFQTALMDSGTLNLLFFEETRHYCIRCGSCVRTCPMGIDIRSGFQIECIGCGRCIDACRGVMERRPGGFGLIGYRFGTLPGAGITFGSKALALVSLTIILGGGLVWGVTGRAQTAFVVQRIATVEARTLPDGFQVQPWRATIGNRSEAAATYSLRISSSDAGEISLLGPVSDIPVAANEHREVTFMIRHTGSGIGSARLLLLNGTETAASVQIKP